MHGGKGSTAGGNTAGSPAPTPGTRTMREEGGHGEKVAAVLLEARRTSLLRVRMGTLLEG